jgi:hypothetical protein
MALTWRTSVILGIASWSAIGGWAMRMRDGFALHLFISASPVGFTKDALESSACRTARKVLHHCYRVDALILGIVALVAPLGSVFLR